MGDRLATTDMGRTVGAAVPLSEQELGGRLTNVAWADAYLHTNWHLDPSSRLDKIDMGRKVGELMRQFRREAGSPSNTMGRGLPPYQVTSYPSSLLATIDMGRNVGAHVPLFSRGRAESQSIAQCRMDRGLPL